MVEFYDFCVFYVFYEVPNYLFPIFAIRHLRMLYALRNCYELCGDNVIICDYNVAPPR
jgi:hypothetical protein